MIRFLKYMGRSSKTSLALLDRPILPITVNLLVKSHIPPEISPDIIQQRFVRDLCHLKRIWIRIILFINS